MTDTTFFSNINSKVTGCKNVLKKIFTVIGKTVKYAAYIALIFVVISTSIKIHSYFDYLDNTREGIENFKDSLSISEIVKEEKKLSGDNIEAGLVNVGKLCTEEYHFTHVENFEKAKEVWGREIGVTKTQYIYALDGVISAGVDFSEIDVDVDDDNKVIYVNIPKACIAYCDVDNKSLRVYSEKQGWFNEYNIEDVVSSLEDLEESEMDKAIKNGILDDANAQAEMLVTIFIQSLPNTEEYSVNIMNSSRDIALR